MLGVAASIGRTLAPEDDQPTAPPVAVISHPYWRSRFGSDPNVIGRVVRINNVPITIVGVIAPTFTGIQRAVQTPRDVTVPLALDPQLNPDSSLGGPSSAPRSTRLNQPTVWWLQVMGRLKPGVTAAEVQANLEGVFRHTARAGLDAYLGSLSNEARNTADNRRRSEIPRLRVDSGSRGIYDANTTDTRALAILSGVVVLMLLIVCANVANLLLSRATSRQKEVSVRLSLGATRARLVRQLLTESVLLASFGGALGLLIGHWGKRLLPGASGEPTSPDWRVLVFVVAVTSVTAIVFGIAPALRATGINVNSALKENSRSVVGTRSLLTKSLLVAQVSISLVLLVGAGLFLRTVQNLRQVDVGFNTQNLVLFRVNPQLNRYDAKRIATLYRDIMDRLGVVGGVRSAALSQPALLSGSVNQSSLFVQGRSYTSDQRDSINRLVVSPNFFDMMEMRLLLGRGLTEADHESAPRVAVINDTAAQRYFPNQNPIGQRFGHSVETADQVEIVGILRDTKYDSLREPTPPTMYESYLQARTTNPSFTVRTAGDPTSAIGTIRDAVRQIDPNLR
jgi:predicted permease